MAATPSTMLPLGTPFPTFELLDPVTGGPRHSKTLTGPKGTLVMFICNHCPFVIHVSDKLLEVAHRAVDAGFGVVAINSNSTKTHPQDGPEHMKALALNERFRFPFLFDESQDVARAFQAACTPDFFVFDAKGLLAYRGQFDDSRPSNGVPVTGKDLQAALASIIAGAPPSTAQKASIGCNIKWHPS